MIQTLAVFGVCVCVCGCRVVVRLRAPDPADARARPEEAIHDRADPTTPLDAAAAGQRRFAGRHGAPAAAAAAAAAAAVVVVILITVKQRVAPLGRRRRVRRTDTEADAHARH